MRRIPTTLAAMAAAAAVAAAITLPAVAQSGGGATPDPALARFTTCLTAHGVTVPAGLGGVALKQWLGERADRAPVAAALRACGASRPRMDDRKVAELAACLRDHGVDVANAPDALKHQVATLSRTGAGRATLAACGTQVAPKPAAGACGSGEPDGAPAAKPDGT